MTIPGSVPARRCPSCGGHNQADATFCQHCGYSWTQPAPFVSPPRPVPPPPLPDWGGPTVRPPAGPPRSGEPVPPPAPAPPPLRQLAPDLPDSVEGLVLRCLARSPEARFADFGALRIELTTAYEAVAGHPPELPDPVDDDEVATAGLAGVELARAISLVTLARYEEAMTFFDQAVEHDPALARAWYFRGLALNGLGRFDEALGCFDRAIEINPWHLAALYEKGVCLLFLGRFAEAAAYIDEVAAIQPGPAVDAAREACLAGLAPRPATPGNPTTMLEPIDGLDLRT